MFTRLSKRIHIVGIGPRTGTTLLAQCMANCFEIDGYEQHESKLRKLRRNVDIYLTKWPRDLALAAPRLKWDKHFYVVCMGRDPRNAITSFNRKYPDKYFCSLAIWKEEFRQFRRLQNADRLISIKYEDLVAHPDGVQEILMRRMPFLRKTASFSDFHKIANVSEEAKRSLGGVRPIYEREDDWRKHLPRVAGQVALYGSISDELVQLDYEPDENWTRMLKGIEPDMSSSAHEAPASLKLRMVRSWLNCVSILLLRSFGVRIASILAVFALSCTGEVVIVGPFR